MIWRGCVPLKRGGVGGRCSERRGSAMRRPGGWTGAGVERRRRDEARNTARLGTRQWQDFVRTSGWRRRRRRRRVRGPPGQVSTSASSVCARSASSGSAMSTREPRLTHPAPVHAANSWSTSGYERRSLGRPHARFAIAQTMALSQSLRGFLPCLVTRLS